MQTDKNSFISIRKSYEKFGNYICLFLQKFKTIAGCDTASFLFNVSKQVVFEQISLNVSPLNVIVGISASRIIVQYINNEVKKFAQRYMYCGK